MRASEVSGRPVVADVPRRFARVSVLALAAITMACEEDSTIPLDPGGTPLYSAVSIGREDLVPVARDTIPTGETVDFSMSIFHQRAELDTAGVEGADLSVRLWAQDRLAAASADVRVLVFDTVLPIEGTSGLVSVGGTTASIPECEGVEFFVFDVRLRNRPPEGAAVVLARDSEFARIAEEASC